MRKGLLGPPGFHAFVGVFHVGRICHLIGLHFGGRLFAFLGIGFAEFGIGHFDFGLVGAFAAFLGLRLGFAGLVRALRFRNPRRDRRPSRDP